MDRNKFLCFFFYSVFLLFFISPDSYLYDVFHRFDSAIFFTSGKAWMNGMVPYVDFADSKGPLLWLIYGIGYLLNSHSYVGVFWVSCVFYAVSFTFAYKLSRLYLNSSASSIVIAILPLFLFDKFNDEVRAEDYCITFVFVSLYCLCRVLNGVDKRQLYRYAFGVGVSMSCCLLIKWNYFFTLGSIALVVLFISMRMNTFSGLWGGLVGIATPLIPFLVYFLIQGNFDAFVSEYFLNTASTVSLGFEFYLKKYISLLPYMKKGYFLIPLGVILFCYRHKSFCWLVFPLFVFYAIVFFSPFPHYYHMVFPFIIFLLISILEYLQQRNIITHTVTVFLVIACVLGSTAKSICFWRLSCSPLFDHNNAGRQDYYNVSQLMATIKKPKVMFVNEDMSAGVLADALPACTYWTRQFGSTPDMLEEREHALRERKPDFVIARPGPDYNRQIRQELDSLDYVCCSGGENEFIADGIVVYCKKELYRKLPPVKLRTIDLLLKRDILCGNSEGR